MRVSLVRRFFQLSMLSLTFAFVGFALGLAYATHRKGLQPTESLSESMKKGSLRWQFDSGDPLLAKRKILLNTQVNELAVQQVVATFFYLDSLDSNEPIDLLLNSTGGSTVDAKAIIDAMRLIKAPVNTWAIGTCRSAAAEILAGVTGRRFVTPNSSICFHYFPVPNDSTSDSREATERSISKAFWLKEATLPDRFLNTDAEVSVFLTASQAVKYGIADEVAVEK